MLFRSFSALTYTAVNFALEVNAEKCAAITEHVSLCLIDAREAMKDMSDGTVYRM